MCTANEGGHLASGIFTFLLSIIKQGQLHTSQLPLSYPVSHPLAPWKLNRDKSRHANKMSTLTHTPNGKSTIDAKALLGVCFEYFVSL